MDDTITTFIIAWSALGAAAISPGPNMIAVASRGLGQGRGAALTVALGIASGGFIWASLSSLGLSWLLGTFPILLTILSFIGGAYLIWLGVKGWQSALSSTPSPIAPSSAHGFWAQFTFGLYVTITNPKVALLWGSLSTYVASTSPSALALLIFATTSSAILFLIYGGYGLLFSTGQVRRVYARFQNTTDALFGSIFGLIGVIMIYTNY